MQLDKTENINVEFYTETKFAIARHILLATDELDLIKFLSLLSLLFKDHLQNDILVQILEVEYLRPNAYKITDIHSLLKVIDSDVKSDAKDTKQRQREDILRDMCKTFCFQIVNVLCDLFTKCNNNVTPESFVDTIDQVLSQNKDTLQKNIALSEERQMTLPILYDKCYTLSPTSGIAMLNNNPYSFFVSKVLGLRPIIEWDNAMNASVYGDFIHQIARDFADECSKISSETSVDRQALPSHDKYCHCFWQIVKKVLQDRCLMCDDFLKHKLQNIQKILINLEQTSARFGRVVWVEKELFTVIDGVRIFARADRVEINLKRQEIYIYDFKTGDIPDNKKELDGTKSQLSVIAMLMLKKPEYKNFTIKELLYIDLSGKDKVANEEIFVQNDPELKIVENNLRQQVSMFFKNGQPQIDKMFYIKPTGKIYDEQRAVMYLHRDDFVI